MKCAVAVILLRGLMFTGASLAQPAGTPAPQAPSGKAAGDDSIENVIVTGEKQLPAVVHNFIRSYGMAASPLSGAITAGTGRSVPASMDFRRRN